VTNSNIITPKAQEIDAYIACEGRASRQMIANYAGVSGPRANELIDQLLHAGRITRVARGIYQHTSYNHVSPTTAGEDDG